LQCTQSSGPIAHSSGATDLSSSDLKAVERSSFVSARAERRSLKRSLRASYNNTASAAVAATMRRRCRGNIEPDDEVKPRRRSSMDKRRSEIVSDSREASLTSAPAPGPAPAPTPAPAPRLASAAACAAARSIEEASKCLSAQPAGSQGIFSIQAPRGGLRRTSRRERNKMSWSQRLILELGGGAARKIALTSTSAAMSVA